MSLDNPSILLSWFHIWCFFAFWCFYTVSRSSGSLFDGSGSVVSIRGAPSLDAKWDLIKVACYLSRICMTSSGQIALGPGGFWRLREVVYGSGKFSYGSGKFFYGSGKLFTALGSCVRLREVFLRLREVFLRLREVVYGSGKLFTAPGSFFTAPGSFSTAPGSCLRLREVLYGSGKFFTAPGSFSTALGSCVRLREVSLRLREVFLRLREVVYGSRAGGGGYTASTEASTAHATRFGRIEVRCEPRGCPTVFSWRISPYATSTPTRFGPRTRGPQLGSALTFLHSKAPFHVRES